MYVDVNLECVYDTVNTMIELKIVGWLLSVDRRSICAVELWEPTILNSIIIYTVYYIIMGFTSQTSLILKMTSPINS